MLKQLLPVLVTMVFLSSCAILHHTQIGEINSGSLGQPFQILVSETGINIEEIGSLMKASTSSKAARQDIGNVGAILGLFQMGPKTGNMVFSTDYADYILAALLEKCPEGRISGLNSIRETNKYPIVSGEIIKVTGYCQN